MASYGWFELRVLAGSTTSDPVIAAAVAVQAGITRWLVELGSGALVGLVTALAALLVAIALGHGRRRAGDGDVPAESARR